MLCTRRVAVVLAGALLIGSAVLAAVPQLISLQGRLTDDTGAPLPDGAKSVRFIIWNDPTSTLPTNEIWNSGPVTVETIDGLFSVNLGEPPMAQLSAACFSDTNLWVGITVEAEPEGSPRIKVTSYAFAFRSVYADSSTYAVAADQATIAGYADATAHATTASFADTADHAATATYADTAAYALAAPAGAADHGSLAGLGDDDHPQYLLADGSRAMAGDLNVGKHQIHGLEPGTDISDAVRYDQAIKDGDSAGGDLTGTYPAPQLASNSVGSTEIAAGAVFSSEVADNSLTDLDLAAGSVGSAEVIDNSLTAADLAAGAVAASEVLDNSLTSSDLATGAVYSDEIHDGTIVNADISASAAIAVSKIVGTAVDLASDQTISGDKTFDGDSFFGDSTMTVGNYSVLIGTPLVSEDWLTPLEVKRTYNTTNNPHGFDVTIHNQGTGNLYGIDARITAAVTNNSVRCALQAQAGDSTNTGGSCYGVRGRAYGGDYAYGIYGRAGDADLINFAGYFYGDVDVVGTLSKDAGAFKIDHPLDPENKYLQHSFVESPDMMNVYNGNVTTDARGYAAVTLPDYFEALNRDFRYQVTVIGQFAQAIISEKISGGRFVIQTDKPNVEVSWMVTGIRKDPYAEAYRIEVEVEKLPHERGYFRYPEGFGRSADRSIDRQHDAEPNQPAPEASPE